uniref:Uncharacterized protein n=1 Tax=Anguilla anguilla TaxID=7936 RepID=A0A0E9PHC8_ANGAN
MPMICCNIQPQLHLKAFLKKCFNKKY